MTTAGAPDISVPARAIGDPARARMVSALMGGVHLPAGELARAAGVAPSTASEHLRILQRAGLVVSTRQGRHRYYRLRDDDVARAVEALQLVAPSRPVSSLNQHRVSVQLQQGRRCYDHLAGELGIRVTDLLRRRGIITDLDVGIACAAPDPLPTGELAHLLGLDRPPPPGSRRPWARGCLDWTRRRPHVAGHVGAQALRVLEEKDWVRVSDSTRAVTLTPAGEAGFVRLEDD